MTMAALFEQFPDEAAAQRWLEGVRWSEGRVCGHCGSPQTNVVSQAQPMPYWCATCRHYFSVKTGTALQRSRLSLRAWVLAIFVMTMHRTEEASLPVICQTLAVGRPTARSMIRRIRQGSTYRLISASPHLVARAMFQQAETKTPTVAVPWQLQKGDLVREKAGGPVMVIMWVYPDRESARCRWVEGTDWTDAVFPLGDLQRVTRLSKPVT
jgi:transposase-like protein/uncharacterized protein YodC (DUF2158 family)